MKEIVNWPWIIFLSLDEFKGIFKTSKFIAIVAVFYQWSSRLSGLKYFILDIILMRTLLFCGSLTPKGHGSIAPYRHSNLFYFNFFIFILKAITFFFFTVDIAVLGLLLCRISCVLQYHHFWNHHWYHFRVHMTFYSIFWVVRGLKNSNSDIIF